MKIDNVRSLLTLLGSSYLTITITPKISFPSIHTPCCMDKTWHHSSRLRIVEPRSICIQNMGSKTYLHNATLLLKTWDPNLLWHHSWILCPLGRPDSVLAPHPALDVQLDWFVQCKGIPLPPHYEISLLTSLLRLQVSFVYTRSELSGLTQAGLQATNQLQIEQTLWSSHCWEWSNKYHLREPGWPTKLARLS